MDFRRKHPLAALALIALIDAGALLCAFGLVSLYFSPPRIPRTVFLVEHLPCLAIALFVWYAVAFHRRLFFSRRSEPLTPQLYQACSALLAWMAITVFLIALLLPGPPHPKLVLAFTTLGLAMILTLRAVFRLSAWDLRRRGFNEQRILIVGANARTESLVQMIMGEDKLGWSVIGFLDDDPSRAPQLTRHGVHYMGTTHLLEHVLTHTVVDTVLIYLPLKSYYERISAMIHLCEGTGVPVRMVADLYPLRLAVSEVNTFEDMPVVSYTPSHQLKPGLTVRRIVDTTVAALLLVLLSPLFAAIALLVGLTSSGPILERTKRTGRQKRPFKQYAFRTTTQEGTPTWVGRLLRQHGLAELPSLFNVFCGHTVLVNDVKQTDMSSSVETAGPATDTLFHRAQHVRNLMEIRSKDEVTLSELRHTSVKFAIEDEENDVVA